MAAQLLFLYIMFIHNFLNYFFLNEGMNYNVRWDMATDERTDLRAKGFGLGVMGGRVGGDW
jgi:hypothetical protein